jgi:transposase
VDALLFLDEFGINLTMTRTHARAPRGQRAHVTEPFHHGSNISAISALGLHGVCAPMMIEGAINSEVFAQYVEHFLVLCLRPGHLVVLDNVKFHYAPKALELIKATGADVLHLPAYSPDFNPIEGCISTLKTTLRSLKARTQRTLLNALAKALALITPEDVHGWVAHSGHIFSLN